MRLIKFLNEEATNKVEKTLKHDECIKLLKEKCSKNIKKNNIHIYRGAYVDKDYLFFDGTKARKSANTWNHYTILFSEILDSWKGIPRRDHSLICGVDLDVVSNFGDYAYRIIPFDDTPLAYTDNDIWNSIENNKDFEKLDIYELESLTAVWDGLGVKDTPAALKSHVKLTLSDLLKNKNMFNFYFSLACLYKKITLKRYWHSTFSGQKESVNNELFELFKPIYEKNIDTLKNLTVKEILDYQLSPKKLKIKVGDYNKINGISEYSEVWMDKPAVLINVNIYDELIKELNI